MKINAVTKVLTKMEHTQAHTNVGSCRRLLSWKITQQLSMYIETWSRPSAIKATQCSNLVLHVIHRVVNVSVIAPCDETAKTHLVPTANPAQLNLKTCNHWSLTTLPVSNAQAMCTKLCSKDKYY